MKEFHQINFDKQKNLHRADIAVLSCLDFRFRKADQEAIEKLGYKHVDWFRWPGVTKPLLTSENFFELFCQAIENVSVKLHHVKKILLLCHWDCGGYGGSKSFSCPEGEEAKYQNDLKQAKEKLKELLFKAVFKVLDIFKDKKCLSCHKGKEVCQDFPIDKRGEINMAVAISALFPIGGDENPTHLFHCH